MNIFSMLQSLVIMGLITPNEAINMLHKRSDVSSISLAKNNSSSISASNFQITFFITSTTFVQQSQTNSNITGSLPLSHTDEEKAHLPVDQRASITLLKKQMQQGEMVSSQYSFIYLYSLILVDFVFYV
ncbi:unnamed protein product [Rotaria sp. Silwood1]|nr:unnamed protein product [Rotaria sp. Silwood1]CAF3475134.1 unnamed protein product [Rotaria sp. Silwood1]